MKKDEVLDRLGKWFVTYDAPSASDEQQALMIIVKLIANWDDSASESETVFDLAGRE